ncbi:MAG: protoglobin domain-containing protein [Meiothermus ruber]|jgi:hypothetical protein|uniref:Globin n=1 Tax=Meiothermus ruber TaxID=277 RepID=A0A7C3DS85_MEIRU|nr:protoglobin domain-containing protein [Meiothermus ruber]
MHLTLSEYFQVAQAIWDTLPPATRFGTQDASTIETYRSHLQGWEDWIINGFYDTLFSHPATRSVFREGERAMREQVLRVWYRRTIAGPFDLEYFAWQVLVGRVHQHRGISRSQVLVMWGWITEQIWQLSHLSLPLDEADQLSRAWVRLANSVQAMAAAERLEAYLQAMEQSGASPRILQSAAVSWLEEQSKDAGHN